MQLIYYFFTIALLLINLSGLTALAGRWIPHFALARSAGILLLVMGLFFVEHFIGLGNLSWLWPISTVLALLVLYKRRAALLKGGFLNAEYVFWAAFFYGLFWRFSFPAIHPSSEKITDLYFITNYLSGVTLPPPDLWFPPGKFDFYYAMQHYGASLMARIFGMSGGLSYNLAFPVLMALPITLAWEYAGRFLAKRWQKLAVVLALAIGGTGVSPLMHIISQDPAGMDMPNVVNQYMWGSQRFTGGYDQILNTGIGNQIFPRRVMPANEEVREIPMENYGYQFYLGDYHPPLGGFFLVLFAIALIGILETRKEEEASPRVLQFLLALTVPAMIATNTWAFPLQAALVGGWAGWRWWRKAQPDWLALIGGGVIGFMLLYPFLTGLAAAAQPTPIRLVKSIDHTPILQFMVQHWPTLLFALVGLLHRETRRLSFLFAIVFGGLMLMSEFIYVDDVTGGRYERTNTTMKWWGWIHSAAIVALGVQLLASGSRWVRIVAVATFVLISTYVYDLGRYWLYTGKSEAGQLEAHTLYTRDNVVRDMYRYLDAAPDGIVLENIYGGAFTESGLYSLFARKPVLLGWPMHLLTWHAGVGHMWILKEQVEQFYKGQLPDPSRWLQANQVRYVVWNGRDAQDGNAWKSIQQNIGDAYTWQGFYTVEDFKVGFWVRRDTQIGK